jgi:hypothetical protein
VNSRNWIVRDVSIVLGGLLRYGRPWTQRRLGRKRELQWHLDVEHVHGRSHVGTVFSGGLELK